MKPIIISFILYVLYDLYWRKKNAEQFITKDEFLKYQQSQNSELKNLSGVFNRVNRNEQSAFA
jgi:hypothetical protein